ncbi:MAG: HAMP domain-containing protein [Pyrinomonadaceae bacterium]|jgi:heavy metal sensor kinase|nr:HAMP domain-containing protein [Pyrinomonadaceae bacterium]
MVDSVRYRLTLWYLGVLGLVLLAFSAGVYALLTRSLNQRLDNGLRASLESVATSLTRELTGGLAEAEEIAEVQGLRLAEVEGLVEKEAVHSTMEDFSSSNQAIAVFDGQGRLLAEKAAPGDLHADLPSLDLVPVQSVYIFTLPGSRGSDTEDVRVAVRRIPATTASAPYLIAVAQSFEANTKELELLRRSFYIAIPIALALAGLGGFFLARKSLAPMAAMSERARRISAENLEERLPVANPRDALGQLAATFNELLARLNASFDQQRQFMADASHELRTPLSVMHTAAEVTLEQPRRTESEYREALQMVDAQTRRLARIVEDMFTLARADAGRRPLHPSNFYLDELTRETARAAEVLAVRKRVSVEVSDAAEIPFRGDEGLLRQMLLNLLDNAIRHTPAGGHVSVSLAQFDSAYEITVADSGTGIPGEVQAHIFERFYRADAARSRAEPAGGSGAGLGLAIARWIAEAHDGRLELRRSDESGSVFVASLPASPR